MVTQSVCDSSRDEMGQTSLSPNESAFLHPTFLMGPQHRHIFVLVPVDSSVLVDNLREP